MNRGEVRRRTAGEVGSHDVACSVFLARHSAYLEHELLPRERQAHERHQATCASCARYARVLAGGVDVLRGLPEIEPSAEFEARLQHRLFHVQDQAALAPRRRSAGWIAAAAAVLLVAAGDRLLDSGDARSTPAPRYDASALPAPATGGNGWAASWQAVTPAAAIGEPAAAWPTQAYSPVIVQPPQYLPVYFESGVGD